MKRLGIFMGILLGAWALYSPVTAAPDRLNDDIPDAVPDQPGAISLSYGHEDIDVEGFLNDERTAHDYFKIRYTFSPKVAVSFKLTDHDLVGGLGLLNPMMDLQDSAESFTFDLALNLMNLPMTPADEDKGVAFVAGSSFGIGVSGSKFTLDQANLKRDETLLKAYLMYTTDLSEDMRVHTYFSSGRLSGDTHTGSVNRVGAGLDYDLITGRRPLVLMVNGVLDIYNFREPVFNTSRISRFEMGLRYRVARDWYASAGWVTLNDSENDASGSGIFAGVNFIPGSPDPVDCIDCEEEEVTDPAAEGNGPTQASSPPPANPQPVANPPLMALNTNGFDYQESNPDRSNLSGVITSAKSTSSTSGSAPKTYEDNGINIPPYPGVHPQQTPGDAVMVRPNGDTRQPPSPEGNTHPTQREAAALHQVPNPNGQAPPTGDEPVIAASNGSPGLLSVSTGSFAQKNTLDKSVYLPLFDGPMEPVKLDFLHTGTWLVYSNFAAFGD